MHSIIILLTKIFINITDFTFKFNLQSLHWGNISKLHNTKRRMWCQC